MLSPESHRLDKHGLKGKLIFITITYNLSEELLLNVPSIYNKLYITVRGNEVWNLGIRQEGMRSGPIRTCAQSFSGICQGL